jgi:4-hydroxybenzoate polyprenyltransferase
MQPEPLATPRSGTGKATARRSRVAAVLHALRLHHWVKNLLVFVPLLLAHRAGEPGLLADALVAFLAFGCVASTVYVLTDLVDREADRQHPRKRRRPFAAGELSVPAGALLAALGLAAGAALAATLPPNFRLLLAAYAGTSFMYSLWLKRVVVLDVLVLAGLYALRVLGGAAATGVPASEWLLSFAMFVFLSLALLKRASELVATTEDLPGRGYRAVDRESVFSLGAASGYLSVLVLALYVASDDVRRLYAHPERLWLLCPLLLYWVSRLWIEARRGNVSDDPVVHAVKDPVSYVVLALGAGVVWLAN